MDLARCEERNFTSSYSHFFLCLLSTRYLSMAYTRINKTTVNNTTTITTWYTSKSSCPSHLFLTATTTNHHSSHSHHRLAATTTTSSSYSIDFPNKRKKGQKCMTTIISYLPTTELRQRVVNCTETASSRVVSVLMVIFYRDPPAHTSLCHF